MPKLQCNLQVSYLHSQYRLRTYAAEIIGSYQAGFTPEKSSNDQIFAIRQIFKKLNEYKQAFGSIYQKKAVKDFKINQFSRKRYKAIKNNNG